jgi:tetratricopeptide (TPR) repeat protein
MSQAFEARGARRVELARRALEKCADCADAWVLLAEETAQSIEEGLGMYEKAMTAAVRGLGGEEALKEHEGHFWGVVETRPYMRARRGVASLLVRLGRPAEAAGHFEELLRLNPRDNQGNRDSLLYLRMTHGPASAVDPLLALFPDDSMAEWTYTAALHRFRSSGDTPESRAALARARSLNPHLPDFLLGRRPVPETDYDSVIFGDETEAAACAQVWLPVWRETPGALAWLEAESRKPVPKK